MIERCGFRFESIRERTHHTLGAVGSLGWLLLADGLAPEQVGQPGRESRLSTAHCARDSLGRSLGLATRRRLVVLGHVVHPLPFHAYDTTEPTGQISRAPLLQTNFAAD